MRYLRPESNRQAFAHDFESRMYTNFITKELNEDEKIGRGMTRKQIENKWTKTLTLVITQLSGQGYAPNK